MPHLMRSWPRLIVRSKGCLLLTLSKSDLLIEKEGEWHLPPWGLECMDPSILRTPAQIPQRGRHEQLGRQHHLILPRRPEKQPSLSSNRVSQNVGPKNHEAEGMNIPLMQALFFNLGSWISEFMCQEWMLSSIRSNATHEGFYFWPCQIGGGILPWHVPWGGAILLRIDWSSQLHHSSLVRQKIPPLETFTIASRSPRNAEDASVQWIANPGKEDHSQEARVLTYRLMRL